MRRPTTRTLAAAYFGGRALVDVAWWIGVATSTTCRRWFELDPTHRGVLNAFWIPGMALLGITSAAACVASAYATLYIGWWVVTGGHGQVGIVAMTVETALMVVFLAALVKDRGR